MALPTSWSPTSEANGYYRFPLPPYRCCPPLLHRMATDVFLPLIHPPASTGLGGRPALAALAMWSNKPHEQSHIHQVGSPFSPSININDIDACSTALDALQVRRSLDLINPPLISLPSFIVCYRPPAIYSFRVSMELGISMRKLCYLNPCGSGSIVLLPRLRTRVRDLVSSMNCLKFGSAGFREGSDRLQLFYSTILRHAPHVRRSFVNMYSTIDITSLGCPPLKSLWAKLDWSLIEYDAAEHSPSLFGITYKDDSLNSGFVDITEKFWMPLLVDFAGNDPYFL